MPTKSLLPYLLIAMLSPAVNASTIVEIIFTVDSSGSLGLAGWEAEKDYMKRAIADLEAKEDADIRYDYGIVVFSDLAQTEYRFFDDQSLTALNSTIDALFWLNQSTSTRRGIDEAINDFLGFSSGSSNQHLILLTDGDPFPSSQHLCNPTHPTTEDLHSYNIQATVVGFGSTWNQSSFDCLVDDVSAGILNDDFSGNTLDDLINRIAIVPTATTTPTPTTVSTPSIAWLLGSALLALFSMKHYRQRKSAF